MHKNPYFLKYKNVYILRGNFRGKKVTKAVKISCGDVCKIVREKKSCNLNRIK